MLHLGRPDAQRHEEAGGDQDRRIGCAQRNAQLVRRRDEGVVVPVAVEQVGEEQAAEEHDFGQQEEPHAEGSGLALLLLRLEVMTVLRQRDVRVLRARGLVRVRMCCYDRIIQRSSPLVPSCARATRSHRLHDP